MEHRYENAYHHDHGCPEHRDDMKNFLRLVGVSVVPHEHACQAVHPKSKTQRRTKAQNQSPPPPKPLDPPVPHVDPRDLNIDDPVSNLVGCAYARSQLAVSSNPPLFPPPLSPPSIQDHVAYLSWLGIVIDRHDDQIRLFHTTDATSPTYFEGITYMKELIALSNQRSESRPDNINDFAHVFLILPLPTSSSNTGDAKKCLETTWSWCGIIVRANRSR